MFTIGFVKRKNLLNIFAGFFKGKAGKILDLLFHGIPLYNSDQQSGHGLKFILF